MLEPRRKPRIILAQTAGFCRGVRRAMKIVLEAANDPTTPTPIRTLGPLIHNDQVLELLRSRGVGVLDDEEPVRGGTAVIRAHGASPRKKEALSTLSEKTIDATCPHVRTVQRIAQDHARAGWHCVIVGDRGHAEVEGVLSCAAGRGYVVAGPQDVEELPEMEKLVVVAQTTQNTETFNRTVEKLRARWPDCKVFNTICRSTEFRQAEAARLAQKVDAMVVVGGHHSANTRRLAEVTAATGTPTRHVETDEDLDPEWIAQHQTIGVTAGASTPNWMIRRVLRTIRRAQRDERHPPVADAIRAVLAGPIHTNFFLAGGAAALTYVNSLLMGVAGPPYGGLWVCCTLAFFFLLSQHLLNHYVERDAIYLKDPDKAEFFQRNERQLLFLGVCAVITACCLALLLHWTIFLLVLVGSAAGILYRHGLGRRLGRRVGIQSLQQLAGSKELFVGLAWAVTTAFVPYLVLRPPQGAAGLKAAGVAFALSFLLVGQRTLMMSLRDVEGDQLLGRETIAIGLGQKKSETFFLLSLLCQGALLVVAGGILGWTSRFSYLLLPLIPYAGAYALLFHRRKLPEGELGEALIDGKFYFAGVLALLWALL